jgi:hypothetical protein
VVVVVVVSEVVVCPFATAMKKAAAQTIPRNVFI